MDSIDASKIESETEAAALDDEGGHNLYQLSIFFYNLTIKCVQLF